ncbi:hypothetical protein [Beggiatoa leptomitoformis]|uniref:YggT family protein n=1 Tax=Beggiatoa leptomitoformis TaxID=288004 RepID=A0A2N9YBA3_9GAMM|nr:hypothetical protein [Beggiatoa leptomitoformis]ALG66884.1 hypothetical protein AL038_03080 [Beggiatoa leptomitoformis]AUI67758.1 hypothetical protein BLE401_02960 [Beggiatoa leptomitoformis]
MLQIIIILKGLVEIALFALLGQGILYLLAGQTRQHNPFYTLLQIITLPALKLTRLLMPRVIVDKHIGIITFFLVLWIELLLIYLKVQLVRSL